MNSLLRHVIRYAVLSAAVALVACGKHEPPPARKAGVKVGSVEELVAKLRTEAKVI